MDLKSGVPARWHSIQTSAYCHLDKWDGIEFDAAKHEYKVDGVVRPSVTQILFDGGAISEFSTWNEYARDLGTVVHEECAKYPHIDFATVDPRVMPYLLSYMTWLDHTKFEIEYQERRGACGDLFAGTYDLSGTLPNFDYERGTLYLQGDGSIAKLKVHRGWGDWGIFFSFFNIWRYKHG